MTKHLLSFAAALALTASLASCGSNDKTAESSNPATNTTNPADSVAAMAGDSARMAKKGGVMVDGVAMTGDKNIVQNAMNAKSVSTLVGLVKDAGLVETLSGPGPFTVFAPTNAAFDKLPKAAVEKLMQPDMKADLKKVLTYHVVAGKIDAAELAKDIKANGGSYNMKTVEGGTLTAKMDGDKIALIDEKGGGAVVETPDVFQSNGVVHVIDGVLMPK